MSDAYAVLIVRIANMYKVFNQAVLPMPLVCVHFLKVDRFQNICVGWFFLVGRTSKIQGT